MKICPATRQDHRSNNRRIFELALIVSLFLHLGLFHAFPAIKISREFFGTRVVNITVEDIPITEQYKPPPPPLLPDVPVPTEPDIIMKDVLIEIVDFEYVEIPPPPPPPESKSIEDEYVFVPYQEPPQPIGGLRAIHRRIRYPWKALRLGIQGQVIVGVLVDEKGHSSKTQILKESGFDVGFEKAAVKAAMDIKWRPAKQRDRAVKVWIALPFRFQLVSI